MTTTRGQCAAPRRYSGRVAAAVAATVAFTGLAAAGPAAADFPQVANFCNAWTTNVESITVSSSFRRFVFTQDGTFTTPPNVDMPVRMLLVGGGGGGGAGGVDRAGGGGGGGAVLEFADGAITLSPDTTYTITIGQGGAGSTSVTEVGDDGTGTRIVGGSLDITAAGGAGGGSGDASAAIGTSGTVGTGASVGSSGGGGGAYDAATHAGGSGGTGAGNGGTGKDGSAAQAARRNGGGGGGANPSNGSNGSNSKGGNGGSGESNSDSGVTIAFGGGGGGGGRPGAGTGGSGGGGAGGVGSANGADANTTSGVAGGGGGGGGNSTTVSTSGGAGAPGKVVIAHRSNYACPTGAPSGTPGITGTVGAGTATMTWSAPTTFPSGVTVATWTVLYYPDGSTTAGAIYARGGPATPRSINVAGATLAECTTNNPAWECVLGKGDLTGNVTFRAFARTSTDTVSKLTAPSSAVAYP